MIAARIGTNGNGNIENAAIAVGSCSEVAARLSGLEQALIGVSAADAAGIPDRSHLGALSPIDDVRATADYRQEAALELVRRTLAGCIATDGGIHER